MKSPLEVYEMPVSLFSQWVAYLKIRDGNFEPQKTEQDVINDECDKFAGFL